MSEFTMREYLERIRDRHVHDIGGDGDLTFSDVIGALCTLDAAQEIGEYVDPRSVEPEVAIRNLTFNGMRLVFDPPVRVEETA